MKYKNLREMIADRGWKRASNYSGPDYSDYVIGFSSGRDSDVLTKANFEAAREKLGRHAEVFRFSCWASGWFETIMVRKTAVKTLEKLRDILNAYEDYPVVDESIFHEMESDEQESTLDACKNEFGSAVAKTLGLNADEVASESMELLVRAIYFEDCGYRGIENAFVDAESIKRFAHSYECERMAKENHYAAILLNNFGEKSA